MRRNSRRKSRFLGRGYRAMEFDVLFVVNGIYCTYQSVDLVGERGGMRLEPNQLPVEFDTKGDSIPL
jgi:hypothetical protein